MAEEYKHVEEDIDLSDDEFQVAPVAASSLNLKKQGSHLEIPRDARGEADKVSEEAAARGGEVAISFKHADGRIERASFPLGQDIGFLKAHVAETNGIPSSSIVFTLGGITLIDPLSLADYEAIVKGAAVGPVEVLVSSSA